MELRSLRYFVAVAEELNFRRAAERLYIAQPAISAQVRKLEDELGVQLLNRSTHRVSLTDAGAALLPEARRVLGGAELARQAAQEARHRATNRLRIGYMPASLPAQVPRALRRLGTAMTNLAMSLEPGEGIGLIDAVRKERVDAAVVSLPAPVEGLRTTRVGDEHAVAALSIEHPLAHNAAIRLDQLAPEHLVVLPRNANRGFYDAVVSTCRDAGLSPNFVEMADVHVEPALLAVASGSAMALIPASVAERHLAPGVRFVPLDCFEPAVSMVVVSRRDSSHLPTAAFLRAIGQADEAHEAAPVEMIVPTAV